MFARPVIRTQLLLTALILTACSDSDDPSPTTDAATVVVADAAAATAAPPQQDAGITSAPLDAGLRPAVTPAPSPVPTIKCGSNTCSPPTGSMVLSVACCLPNDACGAKVDLGAFGGGAAQGMSSLSGDTSYCVDTDQGKPDPACPRHDGAGLMLGGCCSKAGTCGVDLSFAGLGCNPIAAIGVLGNFSGAPVDAGPPLPCGAGQGRGGLDASTPAGGASLDGGSR